MNRDDDEDRGQELLATVLSRVLANTAKAMRDQDEHAAREKRARRIQKLETRLQQ
jgi:hypothetical protein